MCFVHSMLRCLLCLGVVGYAAAQHNPFCPQPDGDFPNPASETCASYFRCQQGRPLPRRCPNREAFDFLLRRCSPRDEVNCERQLQLYASPPASGTGTDWSLGGQRGASPGQTLPDQFSLLDAYDQLFAQSGFAPPAAGSGSQGTNPFSTQFSFGQGGFGGQAAFAGAAAGIPGLSLPGATAAVPSISVGPNNQLLADGRNVGHVYATDHGTVIVLTKQPGQQGVNVPTIKQVNTVPVRPQAATQQNLAKATPTTNHVPSSDQPGQWDQRSQKGYGVPSNHVSKDHADGQRGNFVVQGQDTTADDLPMFLNNYAQDISANEA